MRTIHKYFAFLLLLLTAATAQGQTTHKLTVISTVGQELYPNIYSHDERNRWSISTTSIIGTWDEEANGTSCELTEGDSVKIVVQENTTNGWKYSYMEYEGKKLQEDPSGMWGGSKVITFIIPDHDATIYMYAEFDPDIPSLPGLPNGCSWNSATGELFISGFRSIENADLGATSLLGVLEQMGIAFDDVKKVTVMGEIGRQQISFNGRGARKFSNLEEIDLRHTYHYIAYISGELRPNTFYVNFLGTPNLKKLILPSDIENINYFGIWSELPQLEEFTIYAAIPPTFVFADNVPDSCILYVPEQSVAAYKADQYWSKFPHILPIPEGEAENVTVNLPDDFKDGRYVGMSLTLFNAETGEQTKYIVDERPSYIFYSQTCDESYTALLQTAQGVVVAATDTLKVVNKPLEMFFKNVKQLYDMSLTLQTPAEQEEGTPTDVTDQATIVWMDAMGNRICTGNSLARQIEGTRLLYGISLPPELAAHYGVPPRTELIVGANTAQTIVTLAQPDTIILSGKVRDAEGKPIAMATVTASQMMNGMVGKSFTTSTDLLGRYNLTALTGDVTLSATARGYVGKRIEYSQSSLPNLDFTLAPMTGPSIHYDFTYTNSVSTDEEATTLPFYSDYQNVSISAYNETTDETIDSIMVQYPEVQLLSGTKAGDRIRLTATSLKEAFMPVEVTLNLGDDEEKADSVVFNLKQLGSIEASFLQTDNAEVTASLYNSDGLLCRQESFSESTMTLDELKDGDYTLVMIGSDPLFSKILSLDDYAAVKLIDGIDYISNKVTVTSGTIAQVVNDRVPTLNVDPFYYIDELSTSFLPNHTEISTSCNVTLRAEIGFKERYKKRVSNVRVLINYSKDQAEFIEGSTMTGTKMVRATATPGQIIIPVESEFLDEPVRFILTAIDQGTLTASAQVQFDIDGREVTQPLGIATCEVKYMTIVAPDAVYKLSFPVRGNASALSTIRVYAGNDLLVGETHSLADGSWQLHVELQDYPNLSSIPVYAVITTKQGRELKTETTNVKYNKDLIRPLHVYMYPSLERAHLWGSGGFDALISDMENQRIDFDFEHPETINQQWCIVNPTGNGFPTHFEIVFNTTDSTKVHNVILEYLTVKGESGHLRAEYDGNTGHWMCNINMLNDAVCNVDVLQIDEEASEVLLDADLQYVKTHWIEYNKELLTAFNEEVERIISELSNETNTDKHKVLMNDLAELIGVDMSNIDINSPSDITPDEFFASLIEMLEGDSFDINDFLNSLDQYNGDLGKNLSFGHTTGLDPQQLLDEGYTAIKMTDGNTIYELVEESHYVMVDFQNDLRIETIGKAADALARYNRAPYEEDFSTMVNRKLGEIMSWYDQLNTAYGIIRKGAFDACIALQPMINNLANKIEDFYRIYYAPGSPALTAQQQKELAKMCTKKGILDNIHDAMSQMATDGLDIMKYTERYKQLAPKTFLGKFMSGALKVLNGIGNVFSYVAILSDLKEGYDRVNELYDIRREVPDPCEEDQVHADHLRKDIEDFAMYQGWYFIALGAADVLATEAIDIGVKSIVPSLGVSMNSVFGGISATLIKMGANYLNDKTYAEKMNHYEGELRLLQCDEEYRKKQDKWFKARLRQENRHPFPNLPVILDPSGFVYEAVADNRVENATATIYYKKTGEDEYGDQHDEVVKWNAEEFRQENPLLTDAQGKYAWDVPFGLWQVKIEKAGYETAYSDWLPVPPPQLDINIPLVRNTLPDVKTVRAYEDGVEVTFNEYMRPQSLITDNFLLSQNGQPLTCRIEQQDRSRSYDKKEVYASRVKVRTENPLANGSKVNLTIRRQVEAYNGLQMQHDYQQEFTVVREVYAIGTDSIVEVARGEERIITVHAFPAAAAQGMKVIAKSLIGTIATVTSEATFDTNGEAHLTVTGKVGGETALLLSLENSKVVAQSVIMVEDPSMLPVYAPTASHISGTYIVAGETVTLSCETKDATIWYTTDGTCPCDENGTRKKYTTPITVTQPITIRAYAVKGDNVSRVVTFNYNIYDSVGIDDITPSENQVEEIWYTVSGVKLGAKPTQKGVYILNGNKVVVK